MSVNPYVAMLPDEIVARLRVRKERAIARGVAPDTNGVLALAMEIAANPHLSTNRRPTPTGTLVRRTLIEALRSELTAAGLPWEELYRIRTGEEREATTNAL